MCGRYSITVDKSSIEYHFNAKFTSGQIDFELLLICSVIGSSPFCSFGFSLMALLWAQPTLPMHNAL